jgi:hypothetical protein
MYHIYRRTQIPHNRCKLTTYTRHFQHLLYSLAFVLLLANMGSSFVAFITSPLTFSFPDMKSRWALAFPATSFPKSSSERDRVTGGDGRLALQAVYIARGRARLPVGLSPRPLETTPLFLRSTFQLSVSPALFFRVKAKTEPACLMAFLRSASSLERASLIASKASEAGNAAAGQW